LRLRERFDDEATEAYQRDLMFGRALHAITARVDALSAQVAEVRAALGLPVQEPAAKPRSAGPASADWDS
jgi:hypothetical protein